MCARGRRARDVYATFYVSNDGDVPFRRSTGCVHRFIFVKKKKNNKQQRVLLAVLSFALFFCVYFFIYFLFLFIRRGTPEYVARKQITPISRV